MPTNSQVTDGDRDIAGAKGANDAFSLVNMYQKEDSDRDDESSDGSISESAAEELPRRKTSIFDLCQMERETKAMVRMQIDLQQYKDMGLTRWEPSRDTELRQRVLAQNELTRKHESLAAQIEELSQLNTGLQKQVTNLTQGNTVLKKQNAKLQDSNTSFQSSVNLKNIMPVNEMMRHSISTPLTPPSVSFSSKAHGPLRTESSVSDVGSTLRPLGKETSFGTDESPSQNQSLVSPPTARRPEQACGPTTPISTEGSGLTIPRPAPTNRIPAPVVENMVDSTVTSQPEATVKPANEVMHDARSRGAISKRSSQHVPLPDADRHKPTPRLRSAPSVIPQHGPQSLNQLPGPGSSSHASIRVPHKDASNVVSNDSGVDTVDSEEMLLDPMEDELAVDQLGSTQKTLELTRAAPTPVPDRQETPNASVSAAASEFYRLLSLPVSVSPWSISLGPKFPSIRLSLGPGDAARVTPYQTDHFPKSLAGLRDTVVNQLEDWRTGKRHGKIRKYRAVLQKADTPDRLCIDYDISGGGSVSWTYVNPGSYACSTCANKQRACMVMIAGEIWILPLPPQARRPRVPLGDEDDIRSLFIPVPPTDEGYYIAEQTNITQKRGWKEDLKEVWETRTKAKA